MNQNSKTVLTWLGRCLSILGIIFVFYRLRGYQGQISDHALTGKDGLRLVGYSILYGIFSPLLGLSWRYVLDYCGAAVPKTQAVHIYGVTQISKYVPGNIIHLAGRQSMGMAAGIKSWALVKSTVWEFGLLIGISILFGLFTLPVFFPNQEGTQPVVRVLFLLLSAGCWLGLSRLYRSLGYAFLGYVLFLLLTGVVFFFLLSDISQTRLSWEFICATYIVGWLAGLITPGAPAGIGVREWVLMFLLGGVAGEGEVLLAVLLARVVSVGGDFVFFLLALGLRILDKNSA